MDYSDENFFAYSSNKKPFPLLDAFAMIEYRLSLCKRRKFMHPSRLFRESGGS